MSIDLRVAYASPVPVALLVSDVPSTIDHLLDVGNAPTATLEEISDGAALPADPRANIDGEHAWILRLSGHSECAYFGGGDDPEVSSPGGGSVWVSSRARRTPLEHALIAAVAIVIARNQRTSIVDYAGFFTGVIESEVEDFVRRTRIRGPFTDIVVAAAVFDRGLFRSAK